MTPDRRCVEVVDLPGGVVDRAPAVAVLDGEAGRRDEIKRDHVIVGVLTQRHPQRDLLLPAQVPGQPHVVERPRLHHQVRQVSGLRAARAFAAEAEAVMARVAAQESEPHGTHLDRVRQAETEIIAIEVNRRLRIAAGADDVAEAELIGHESPGLAQGAERRVVRRGLVEDLHPYAVEIREPDQPLDVASVTVRIAAPLDLHPRSFEAARHRVHRSGIGDFPADVGRAVARAGVQYEAVVTIIDAQVSRIR